MINDLLLYISWDISPNIYEGFLTVRYYSLFFAISFILGFYLVKKMYLNESAPVEWMDKLLVYTVFGTIIGARLGHVLFYEADYYLENLGEVLMIWKGGLASHGAAIALIISMYLYSKKITKKKTLWSLDKLVVVVALAAGFIRMGNLMNSEIVGIRTDNESGFFYEKKASEKIAGFFGLSDDQLEFTETNDDTLIDGIKYPKMMVNIRLGQILMKPVYAKEFTNRHLILKSVREADFFTTYSSTNYHLSNANLLSFPVFIIPRIPTQLYESFSYWAIFLFLFWAYWKKQWYEYQGRLFGAFLTLLFMVRFILEFFKEHQTLEDQTLLNMGQYLSIPCILVGLYYWIKSKKIVTD